ncbi:hypothetical protein D7D52_18435 [Nocardia yunnanensis]|uniref:Uncharacterized protein n=1 Tax=Nocardia yunnanensis TaxID=2382165 RepID=A0A386ZE93_9NOCA|nr:hypothetical protein [Nocardia yunnanensis]AYF75503.1 hypothetical protein D7D52_18435 [Nocardia yunnanensis]
MEVAQRAGAQAFRDQLSAFTDASNEPPSEAVLDTYLNTYRQQYQSIVGSNLVYDKDSLDELISGGAQAPNAKNQGPK